MLRWLVLLTLLLPLRPAVAEAPPLLAVLELEAPDQAVTPDELLLLTDTLRSAVVDVAGQRFKVLTRETMAELVPPERMTCFVDKCAAEIGRMLQAPYVVAGNIRKLGKSLVVTVEAYETNGGGLLGSRQLMAVDTEALFSRMSREVRPFVASWLPTTQGKAEGAAKVSRPSWALRGGLSGQAGFVGLSAEWRPSWWGVVLGTGYMPVSAGLTFGSPANEGGPYLDLFSFLVAPSPFANPERTGMAFGASAGWDWRWEGWTAKTGLGLGATTLPLDGQSNLVVDLSIGRVF